MKLVNELVLILFILMISKKHNIDESHDVSHSMDALHFANDIDELLFIDYNMHCVTHLYF